MTLDMPLDGWNLTICLSLIQNDYKDIQINRLANLLEVFTFKCCAAT